ncbi:MAG: hypothetical protein ACOCVP_08450 [Wenzhouxiangella sp.]
MVADLGTVRSGTVALFSDYRCRLDVLDLPMVLPQLAECEEAAQTKACLAALFDRDEREPLDLVLCWNLLNYLKREEIRELIDLLVPRFQPQTRLHALMEYASPLMPATPGHWIPDANTRLHASHVDAEQIDSPRYKPKELERIMPQLAPERTVLLGNGLQEYLFRPKPEV